MEKIKSIPLREVEISDEPSILTRNSVWDSWYSASKGMIKGTSTLVFSLPGTGKSTLFINLMKWLDEIDVISSMYQRETMSSNLKNQTKNVIFENSNAFIVDGKRCKTFNDYMIELDVLRPSVVVLDSLQAMTEDFPEMSEDEACKHMLKTIRKWLQDNDAVGFIICHSTKGGIFMGTNQIAQYVDSIMELEYNEKTGERIIKWGSKNRNGPLGKIYYQFEKEGIKLFTESEWQSLSTNRSFPDSLTTMIQSYANTIKNKQALKVYNQKIRKISKMGDENKICTELVGLMLELSNEYGI